MRITSIVIFWLTTQNPNTLDLSLTNSPLKLGDENEGNAPLYIFII